MLLKLAAPVPVPGMSRSRPQKNSPKHPGETELPVQISGLRDTALAKTPVKSELTNPGRSQRRWTISRRLHTSRDTPNPAYFPPMHRVPRGSPPSHPSHTSMYPASAAAGPRSARRGNIAEPIAAAITRRRPSATAAAAPLRGPASPGHASA